MPPNVANDDRKVRGDSVLDTQIAPAQRDEVYAYIERHTLNEAQAWLIEHFNIELSTTAIGRWAEKRRRAKADFAFANLLRDIKADQEQAVELSNEVGQATEMADANVVMLSQALFEAKRSGNPAALKNAAKLFSMVLESVAKSKTAQANLIAAETGRDKFQYDAAKSALANAAELQRINQGSGDEDAKVERAIISLFGRNPNSSSNIAPAADVSTSVSSTGGH